MIVSLQSDIMDINEIFKDLGMMIHEQGDVIGKPNSNIIWKVTSCREQWFCWKNSSSQNVNAKANQVQLNMGRLR